MKDHNYIKWRNHSRKTSQRYPCLTESIQNSHKRKAENLQVLAFIDPVLKLTPDYHTLFEPIRTVKWLESLCSRVCTSNPSSNISTSINLTQLRNSILVL